MLQQTADTRLNTLHKTVVTHNLQPLPNESRAVDHASCAVGHIAGAVVAEAADAMRRVSGNKSGKD
ncbi:MAG TPA: hypothetical protein VFJ01_08395 [Oleiagrimonas sp.]|nr:hypothetical protein [Oleiagrimonas sp.]